MDEQTCKKCTVINQTPFKHCKHEMFKVLYNKWNLFIFREIGSIKCTVLEKFWNNWKSFHRILQDLWLFELESESTSVFPPRVFSAATSSLFEDQGLRDRGHSATVEAPLSPVHAFSSTYYSTMGFLPTKQNSLQVKIKVLICSCSQHLLISYSSFERVQLSFRIRVLSILL